MTLSEFKSWFEGYTEDLDGAPTAKQFKRIKAQVAKIDGVPITRTVFIDHYRQYLGRWPVTERYDPYITTTAGMGVGNASLLNAPESRPPETAWDSYAVMSAAGKADAQLDA